MIYEYQCNLCHREIDFVRSISEHRKEESCPFCITGKMGQVFSSKFYFSGSKPQFAEYNPAFGKVINNKEHRKEEARIREWDEVGNEKPEVLAREAERTKKQKWEQSWAD